MLEAAAGVELGRGQVEWGTQGLVGWTPASHKVGCSKDKKQGLSEGTPHGGGRVGRNDRTQTKELRIRKPRPSKVGLINLIGRHGK